MLSFDQRRRGDQSFLGLEVGDPVSHFTLVPHLARFDGALYGGSAVAVSSALGEAITGRPALWVTAQFVALAKPGDVFDCTTQVVAHGGRVSQFQVQARVGDQVIFSALGATGAPKETALTGAFERMPAVPDPDECDPFLPGPPGITVEPTHFRARTEFRTAQIGGTGPDARMCMWARVPGQPATPAMQAFVADMVPLSVVRATGEMGAGTSLDNTLRFGEATDDEWVLLDLDAHLASGGFGHGSVHIWSRSGRLVANGSQTCRVMLFPVP